MERKRIESYQAHFNFNSKVEMKNAFFGGNGEKENFSSFSDQHNNLSSHVQIDGWHFFYVLNFKSDKELQKNCDMIVFY